MFGHQDEHDEHKEQNDEGLNDASPFAMPDHTSDSPAASPTVGAPGDNDNTPDFIAADAPVDTPLPTTVSPHSDVADAPAANDDLVAIKQSALQQLTPLVGHLEQSPEEKFRTTMMMIQAADDHSLIKAAYEAAQEITDEKAKAQALLDVVNEINYFTQHSS